MRILLLSCCIILTTPFSAQSQGTVHFSNLRSGFEPVSGPDGLLGAEYEAQLQLSDGTNVGSPVSFLDQNRDSSEPSGYFSGGSRSVPGFSGGTEVALQVAIRRKAAPQSDGSGYILLSNVVTIRLGNVQSGGNDSSGSPPTTLDGLEFPPILDDLYTVSEIHDPVLARIASRSQSNPENLDLRLYSNTRSGLKKLFSNSEDTATGQIQSLDGIEQFGDLAQIRLTGGVTSTGVGNSLLSSELSLTPLESLPQLETLDLSGNQIRIDTSRLDLLFALPSLVRLNLDNALLGPVLDLRNLPAGLRELSLRGCGIETVLFPEQANSTLETILLDENRIATLSVPDNLSGLNRVSLVDNPLSKIRAKGYTIIDYEGGIIDPSSFVLRNGKPTFTAHSKQAVIIQRSHDLSSWVELGRKEFRRLNAFIGSTEYTDESYRSGTVFYRLVPITED